MDNVKNIIENVVKQKLNEYLDKDYMMPLRRYMNMDETDQAWECACRLPWLFMEYVNEKMDVMEVVENLIEKGELPEDIFQWEDYEAAERISDFFKTDLKPFCEDFIQYCSYYGERDVPLFCAADFRREVHNEWLVHMTSRDNIPGLYREGFSYGVDIDNLAYTPAIGTTNYKYGAGYNFAFEADDASVAEKSGYGDCAILFQASGVEIYHWGDKQNQVIFYGPSARNLIFLFRDDETKMWYVDSEYTGRRLVEFETLEFLVGWCISNFAQYHNHLVGRNNQNRKFERNIEKRKEKQYKQVSEGIFSKYSELLFEAKATAEEVWEKYYPNIDRNVFNAAVAADPTAKNGGIGKYTKWILNLVKKGLWKPGDSYETTKALERFAKIGNKLEKKDIQQYGSLDELIQTIQGSSDLKTRSETRNDGAEKVYEDEDWMIIHPTTKEAAILYGKGTRWCTAATEYNNRFDAYNDDGPLYIIISKKHPEKKWQFHIESDSFMDVEDRRIAGIDVLSLYGDTGNLFDFIANNIDRNFKFFPKRAVASVIERINNGQRPEDIFSRIEDAGEGMRRVMFNGMYNYIDQNNKLINPYSFYTYAERFSGGFAFVKYKDFEENEVYSEEAGDYFIPSEGLLDRGRYDYNDMGVGNYIDHKGYPLYQFDDEFGDITDGELFDEKINGYAVVYTDTEIGNGTQNLLSKEGKMVFPPQYDYINPLPDNTVIVRMNLSKGYRVNASLLITLDGKPILGDPNNPATWYTSIDDCDGARNQNGYIVKVQHPDYEKFNLYCTNGQPLTDIWFDSILNFKDNWCLAEVNGRYNAININGGLMFGGMENIKNWPTGMSQFTEGIAWGSFDNKEGVMFINEKGQFLNDAIFYPPISGFHKGYCSVRMDDGLMYIIDKNMKPITPGFSYIESPFRTNGAFENGIIFVCKIEDGVSGRMLGVNYAKSPFAMYNFIRGAYLTDYEFAAFSDFKQRNPNDMNSFYSECTHDADLNRDKVYVDMEGNQFDKYSGELVKKGRISALPVNSQVSEGIFSKYINIK